MIDDREILDHNLKKIRDGGIKSSMTGTGRLLACDCVSEVLADYEGDISVREGGGGGSR